MVYYQTTKTSYNLITLEVHKFNRNDSNHTYGCIELENPVKHVAVFAFNREKEIILGHPLIQNTFVVTEEESTSEPGILVQG